jgi:uroporphyrinogen decarboxylase
VFNLWAGELSLHDFDTFFLPSLQHISANVRHKLVAENVPVIPMMLFAKGVNYALSLLAEHVGHNMLG